MKKKFSIFISIIMALTMAFSLSSCKDGDGPAGGGLPPTIENINEQIQEMPTLTNPSEIENAIDEVFGVDINLPDGSCTAQPYSYGGVSAYVVTVTNTDTTATEYYNDIKAEMLANGYMAEDSDLSFYKVEGTIVYSVTVESEGRDFFVSISAASISVLPGNSSGPTSSSSSTQNSPVVLPSGNLSEFPVSQINSLFSVLGVTVPNCTSGSSYSIESLNDDLSTGSLSIKVVCYGMTQEETDAYAQALRDAGFESAYYLVFRHNVSYYSNLVLQRSYSELNQTHTLTFRVEYEAPSYVLPTNLKITYNKEDFYYYTAIKIGEDYYLKLEYNWGTQMTLNSEIYYKKNGSEWDLWENYGDGWEKNAYGTTGFIDEVELEIFDFMVDYASIDEDAVLVEETTLLGRTVNVYEYDLYGDLYTYYKDSETGLILKYVAEMNNFRIEDVVTSYDISVTSFETELPQ